MRGPHGHHARRGMRRGRHMMRPTLLLMMLQGPAHGYELAERLEKFGLQDIDPSLIYRALRKMEEEGFVTSDWDAEKTQGPPRRVYTLSNKGHTALKTHIDDLQLTRERIEQLIDAYHQHAQGEDR